MARMFLGCLLVFASFSVWAYPPTPNEELTTGQLCNQQDQDYMGRKYPEKIAVCRRDVDRDLKRKVYEAYRIPESCRRRYTVDHFIPLSIGGNNAFANLWPEHKLVKAARMDLEQEVFDAVADGVMTQNRAIEKIRQAKMNPDPRVLALLRNTNCDSPSDR